MSPITEGATDVVPWELSPSQVSIPKAVAEGVTKFPLEFFRFAPKKGCVGASLPVGSDGAGRSISEEADLQVGGLLATRTIHMNVFGTKRLMAEELDAGLAFGRLASLAVAEDPDA